MPAGKIDPIGGMFKAQYGIEDKASKPLESISENIDKAVEGSEKLQDEFEGLNRGMEKLHDKTKDVLKKTNDVGIIGAALLGIKGRGSIKDQIKGTKDEMSMFSKFIGGPLTENIGALAAASYSAYQAFTLFAAPLMTMGSAAVAALPGLFLSAAQSAASLITPIEEMRQSIKMTNAEAYEMTGSIVEGMAAYGHSAEEAIIVTRQLGEEGRVGAANFNELLSTSLLLESAFQGLGVDVQMLRRVLVDVGEQGPDAFMGIANAMQHVASTTVLAHSQIQNLINTISNSLIWKLPRDLRMRAMPQIIADITTIAGTWEKMLGNEATLTEGFNAALDIFDEGGHRLKAMIIGLGGATADSMQKMLDEGDAGEFFLAQAQAVQNLRKELGDREFTRLVPMYAEQFGVAREELQRMSQIDIGNLREQMEVTRKLTEDNADVMDAWNRASGIFNDIWNKVQNIGEALLMGLGRPVLKVLIPLIDYFDKFLQMIVNVIGGFSAASTEAGGFALMIGAIGSAVKTIWPLVSMLIGALTSAAVTSAISAIGSAFLAAASAAAPFIAAGMAIAGVLLTVKKAWDDFSAPLLDVIGVIWERLSNIFTRAAEIVVLLTPIGWVIAALTTQWDKFIEGASDGFYLLQAAWDDIGTAIAEVSFMLKQALGEAGVAFEDNYTMFELMGDALGFTAKVIGKAVGGIAAAISLMISVMKPAIWLIGKFVEPLVKLFGMLTDDKSRGIGEFFSELAGTGFTGMALDAAETGVTALGATLAGNIPTMQSGGFTTEDTPAMLHANEAVVPLEKMPEFVQQSVTIDQQAVVDEVRRLRETIEMLARRGNSGTMLYAGGA